MAISTLMSNEQQWMEEMTKRHFGATHAAACVKGVSMRKHVTELSEAPYIINYEDCIDICNNRKANIQNLNKEKQGKLKFPIFNEKFKLCEDTTYILDLGEKTLPDIISELIEKDILKKTSGSSYGHDHWGRKSSNYSGHTKLYSNIVAQYIGKESKININELVPIIYDLMKTEIFIKAYGTWVKGDTTRKDGKKTRNPKPNNGPKQILQWVMMIIMVITDNAGETN
jgi:hypothetical protein